jgi:hypothetical protein
MNKIIAATLTFFLILLIGCKNENEKVIEKTTEDHAQLTQLTQLISYKVFIRDADWKAFVKADSLNAHGANVDEVMGTSVNYLTYKDYSMYLASLKTTILDSNSVMTDPKFKLASKFDERKGLFTICDSLQEENAGKTTTIFVCDSTSRVEQIVGLEFYESWSINKTTGEFLKEIIAFSPLTVGDGDKLIPVYYFFKNKESIDLVKSKQPKK